MNEQKRKLVSWFDEQITICKQRSELFAADDRMDEGNMEKVRANVYDIFKTILSVAEKVCGEDNLAIKNFLLQKAEQIPANWATAYEKARQHEDVEKMHIESIKLDTIREIKDMFLQIWEGTV